jgi:hypothetical protein
MPRPLKVKIFMDTNASAVEEQINAWLASHTSASIIKTETVVGGAAEKSSGAHPFIVVSIWYELPTPDQERPGFRVA